MRRALALLVLSVALGGCATTSKDKTICPEYRSLRCATAPECSFNNERGCFLCQCSPASADQNGSLPTGVAPDRR
jgi:hypothetical protein